jgi:hypothetical protein
MLALMTALALAAADPCAQIEAASRPDPAAAAEFRAVAEEEDAAGHAETAAVAWRKAAALDPGDAKAREALARACSAEGGARAASRDDLSEGIRLLDAGRYREAAGKLRAAQRGAVRADAALLEGICRYELGEDTEAGRLLRIAEADPAHRDTARLYLGLVALREGAAREAATLFDEASANPAVANFATDLARSARWEGPLLVSGFAEAGYDSDVSLTSRGRGPATPGDALGGASVLAIVRPLGSNGLFLRAAGAAQKYARLSDYDFTLLEGAAGWRWWRGGTGVTAEYSLAERTLGGQHYLLTNRFLATGAVARGPFALSGAWQGRFESYGSTWSDYSGFAQRADAKGSVALGTRLRLGVGWGWAHDDTSASLLAWTEQGPRAELRLALGARMRLALEAGRVVRNYEAFDATLGVRQRDVILDGTAAWELDLNPRTTVRLSLLFRDSRSNVAGFDYTKVVPTAGIGVMMTP